MARGTAPGYSDHMLEIAKGNVTKHSFIEKFGRNTAVASGGTETIWDGSSLYSYPASATITHVISGEAADTMDVEVQGLDANFNLVTQEATLNGTTQVALSTALIRVFRVKILGGSDPAGAISVTDTGQSNTYAQVTAGTNQTNMAVYTIPNGYTGYLVGWYASILRATGTNAAVADVDLFRRTTGGVFRSTQPVGIQNTGGNYWQYRFPCPLELAAKTDVEVRATPSANADMSAGFTVILVED